MTGEEYMNSIRIIRRRIRMLREQIERDMMQASGVSGIRYDKERIQTSPIQDRMTDIIEKISKTTDALKEEIHRLQIKEEECIGLLVQLEEKHERVLTYFYLDGYEMVDVAMMMNYTNERYAYEVRDKALASLTEVLKNQKTEEN